MCTGCFILFTVIFLSSVEQVIFGSFSYTISPNQLILDPKYCQEYDQAFYPRLFLVLLLGLAALFGLGGLCVVHFAKPVHVRAKYPACLLSVLLLAVVSFIRIFAVSPAALEINTSKR